MKRFEIYTEERVARTYIVTANSAKEARAKFENGEYDRESPGEAIDCEVKDLAELVDTE